jgi:hypothetical protein
MIDAIALVHLTSHWIALLDIRGQSDLDLIYVYCMLTVMVCVLRMSVMCMVAVLPRVAG